VRTESGHGHNAHYDSQLPNQVRSVLTAWVPSSSTSFTVRQQLRTADRPWQRNYRRATSQWNLGNPIFG